MKSRLNLEPGQKGTKKLLAQYGKALLYVRYRYDESRGVRLKTVEIVVEEKPWNPNVPLKDGDLVPLPIGYGEKVFRERLKAVGGRWDPEGKLWYAAYGVIRGTVLEGRIAMEFLKGKRRG